MQTVQDALSLPKHRGVSKRALYPTSSCIKEKLNSCFLLSSFKQDSYSDGDL